jgi:hypothetical protein
MLSQNVTGKSDKPIMYAFRLLNRSKQNYNTSKREALVMVFSLHKFRHYLLGSKFVFFVAHMAVIYLVNKPQVLGRIAKWLLLFLKYDLTIVYKLGKIHVIVDALLRLPNNTKPTCALNQTIDASLFYIRHEWLNDVKEFLKTR